MRVHARSLNRGGLGALALLLAALAFVLFFRIGDPPASNRAEARVEAVVREMGDGGSWLVPQIDGVPRLHKPPGYYWAAAALSDLVGETTWTTLRAPSALAALLLVVVVFAWGRRLGGAELGLLAALCLATMQFTFAWGRRGVAEMPLALFGTLALASFSRIWFDDARRQLPLFALWIALAILAKATVALLIIGLPIAYWIWREPAGRREMLRPLATWAALGTLVGCLWYAVVWGVRPDAGRIFVSEALLPMGIRTTGPPSALHYRWPLYYVLPLLIGTLPAALFLPLMLRRWWASRTWIADSRKRFVAIALLAQLVGFMLVPQKLRHYLLPLAPLIALLVAESILELRDRSAEGLRRNLVRISRIAAPLGMAALASLALFQVKFVGAHPVLSASLLISGATLLVASLVAAEKGWLRPFAGLCTAAVLELNLAWYGGAEIWRRKVEVGAPLGCRSAAEAPCWQSVREAHPVLAWIFRVRGPKG